MPLDVSTEALCGRRPVFNADAVLLASALEGARMELRTVVDMDDFRQSVRWPGKTDGPILEPRGLRQRSLRHCQSGARSTRRVKRQREASNHPRMHIEHQRQPRTANAGPCHVVGQHDIDLGVVDLNDLQRPFRPQPRHDQAKTRPQS